MRTKEERMALQKHAIAAKNRSNNVETGQNVPNQTKVVRKKGKYYQEIKVNNQKLYVQVKTSKE
tara:strand:+ start:315 stop:506 length:192 start_codon:yes stop_codon:yes gene_type:complete